MEELTVQTLIKARFSGSYTEMSVYISLTIQAIAVMVGGIVLWRMSASWHKRKQAQRMRNSYFETTYSRNWRNR